MLQGMAGMRLASVLAQALAVSATLELQGRVHWLDTFVHLELCMV